MARSHLQQQRFQQERAATFVLQAVWKGTLVRQRLARERYAAQRIQQSWKRHQMKLHHQAATVIQAWARRRGAETNLLKSRRAVVTIQSCWRGVACRLIVHRQSQAAKLVQAAWRNHRLRCNLEQANLAATKLQGLARQRLAQRQYQAQKAAALRIQSMWRCWSCHEAFCEALGATIVLQAAWRRHSAQQLLSTAVVSVVRIQSWMRQRLAVNHFRSHRASVVLLQTVWRGRVQRQSFIRRRRLAQIVQIAWRRHKQERHNQVVLKAALCIQALLRGRLAQQQYQRALLSTIRIQSSWRRHRAQRHYVNSVLPSVTAIQANVRRHLKQTKLRRWRSAAMTIQQWFRLCSARSTRMVKRQAAISIRAKWRAWREVQYYTCVVLPAIGGLVQLQALVRGARARKKATKAKEMCIRLQCFWRAHLAAQRYSWLVHERDQQLQFEFVCAAKIQSAFRGYIYRRELAVLHNSATRIQCAFRGFVERVDYYLDLMDIVYVQSHIRRFQCQKRFIQQKAAALKLQSTVRMWQDRKRCRVMRRQQIATSAATQIQRLVRGYQVRQQQREEHAAIILQKTWRCYNIHIDYMLMILSSIQIQAMVRRRLARSTATRRRESTLRLQAWAKPSCVVGGLLP